MSERDVDLADKMYGGPAMVREYELAFRDSLNAMRDSGTPEPEVAARNETMAHAFFDARIPAREASMIVSEMVRGERKPADDAAQDEQYRESRKALREKYGSDAERRLAAAEQFVKARPEFAQQLQRAGMGSHPRIVLALAERANDLRLQPRKKP